MSDQTTENTSICCKVDDLGHQLDCPVEDANCAQLGNSAKRAPTAFWVMLTPAQVFALLKAAPKIAGPWQDEPEAQFPNAMARRTVSREVELYLRALVDRERDDVQDMLPFWAKVRPEDLAALFAEVDRLRVEAAMESTQHTIRKDVMKAIDLTTQARRADVIARDLSCVQPKLAQIERDLSELLGQAQNAQNAPPDGFADGTISAERFEKMRVVQKLLQKLIEYR